MRIDAEIRDGVLIVRTCEERLDSSVTDGFISEISVRLNEEVSSMILNLGSVDFIDSSGLGSIVLVLKRMGDGRSIAICNASNIVRQMFKITRMDRIFQIFDDEEQALAHLGGQVVSS